MDFEQELDIYFRSRSTLICIVSFEEERILGSVKAVCERTKRSLHVWDHADYFTTLLGDGGGLQQAKDPVTLLEAIETANASSC